MRRREISPEFWTDEKLFEVSDAARLVFVGLWQLADRAGRLEDKPMAIGVKVRPWDPRAAAPAIDELVGAGLVVRYEAGGLKLLEVPNLGKYQHFHHKEQPSKLPGRPEAAKPSTPQQPETNPGHTRGTTQANPSGSTGSTGSTVCGAADAPPPTPPRAPGAEVQLVDLETPPDLADGATGFWSKAQDTRVELGAVREKPPHPRKLGTWWSLALSEVGGDERRLWRAWLLYLEDKHWRAKGSPWDGWVSQWAQFATRAGATSSTITSKSSLACRVCGCELVDGARDERCVCGPVGLPLCRADNERLIDDVGNAVWADGWAQTPAASRWLASVRGEGAAA